MNSNKILIVDDEEINRIVLETGFFDTYRTVHASNGRQALDIIYSDTEISAVLLDLNMPILDGFAVLEDMNKKGFIKRIPVFIVTSSDDENELMRAYNLGAVDVIRKPYNIQFLRRRVTNTIILYKQRESLEKIVAEKTKKLVHQNNRLVEAMADVVEFRSKESGAHVKRVSGFTKILMKGLVNDFNEYRCLENDVDYISFASCLHDLGKISINDNILNKPARLTEDEFDLMKKHTIYGYDQILTLKDLIDPKLYGYSLDIVRHHHERYDGKGYPDNLSGDSINIWSQIVAISDVFDALTSNRCYKKAYDSETSIDMILKGECGVFNPKVIEVFKKYKGDCIRLQELL